MPIEFNEGDEVVVQRRRRLTVKDENGEDTEKVEMTEVSAVRSPAKFKLGGPGGSCLPEYEANPDSELKDRRFLVIKLPMRY